MVRTCSQCKEEKDDSFFYVVQQRGKPYVRPCSKACEIAKSTRWNRDNPDKAKGHCANWRESHRKEEILSSWRSVLLPCLDCPCSIAWIWLFRTLCIAAERMACLAAEQHRKRSHPFPLCISNKSSPCPLCCESHIVQFGQLFLELQADISAQDQIIRYLQAVYCLVCLASRFAYRLAATRRHAQVVSGRYHELLILDLAVRHGGRLAPHYFTRRKIVPVGVVLVEPVEGDAESVLLRELSVRKIRHSH